MTAVSPVTKAARQAQIADILSRTRVRSQEELAELLAQRGVKVAQATLSRDLEDLGAVRLRGAGGALGAHRRADRSGALGADRPGRGRGRAGRARGAGRRPGAVTCGPDFVPRVSRA